MNAVDCGTLGNVSILCRLALRYVLRLVVYILEFATGGVSVDLGTDDQPARRHFGLVFWRRGQARCFAKAARKGEAWSLVRGGVFRLGEGHLVARNGWVSPPCVVQRSRRFGPYVITAINLNGECVTFVRRRQDH